MKQGIVRMLVRTGPLPEEAADPRWMPSRGTLILLAAALQAALIGWGLWYHTSIPAAAQGGAPRLLVREVLIPEDMVYPDTDIGITVGKERPPVDLASMVVATPEMLKTGAALFSRNCASCHGPGGAGDGPVGITLNPRPRNLTAPETWKNGTRLSDIFRTLTLGLDGTQMAAFDYLTADERFALAHHVESLAPGHAADTPASLAELDREFRLSLGTREPSTIPVRTAMERLVAEAAQALRPAAVDDPEAARLFGRATDPGRRPYLDHWLGEDVSWTESPARLREAALSGAPVNGFLPDAVLLTDGEWMVLHRYLLSRYHRPEN